MSKVKQDVSRTDSKTFPYTPDANFCTTLYLQSRYQSLSSFHFLLALKERKEIAKVDLRYLLLRTKQKRHLLIKY